MIWNCDIRLRSVERQNGGNNVVLDRKNALYIVETYLGRMFIQGLVITISIDIDTSIET